MSDFSKIHNKLNKLNNFLEHTAPTIIGVEAVNHFKESFDNEGFTDKNLEKWEDVKRRDSGSRWYGFSYASKSKRNAEDKNATNNFSQSATQRKILTGNTDLKESIEWHKATRGVIVSSALKYAEIHNEGGQIKVFGKHTANLPKRQFLGDSIVLRSKIAQEIKKELIKILKS